MNLVKLLNIVNLEILVNLENLEHLENLERVMNDCLEGNRVHMPAAAAAGSNIVVTAAAPLEIPALMDVSDAQLLRLDKLCRIA